MKTDQITFIKDDFGQSYQQLRHYDSQIVDIFKFLFTAYTAVIGVSYGLFQFGIKENVDLLIPCVSIISIALILGLFALLLITKNRIYFVKNARYLNSIRKHFTDNEEVTSFIEVFYIDPRLPKYFDFTSSQLLLIYFISISNSFLFFSLLIFFKVHLGLSIIILCSGILFLQLLFVLILLLKEERKQS